MRFGDNINMSSSSPLQKSEQAKEESLTEMEKWDARVKETAEYEKVLANKGKKL